MPALKLTSYGAAGEVTGSCHLLQIGDFKLLIDCGFFQGSPENYQKNGEKFGFNPAQLNAVILTHAHLDHCGRLPLLYARGYTGSVYTTEATSQLSQVVLDDNFFIMKERAQKYKLPVIYTLSDLKKLYSHWQAIDYYQNQKLNNNINFTLHDAGHILGSAIIEVKAAGKTIIFSGDLGAKNMPLVKDVDYLSEADYVICEATYGNRRHEGAPQRNEKLLSVVKKTVLKNSTLLISVFAVERTQDVLQVLNDYYETHLDWRVPVYLDSPMAVSATRIYNHHRELLNYSAQQDLARDNDIFNFPHLKITNQLEQSQAINSAPTPKIILAGSGMAEGGRILHHLARYAPDSRNNILFMGYQVAGTLGHHLTHGAFDFHYFDNIIPVKANVEQIDAFSAHADQNDLLEWLRHFKKPRLVLLGHGDKNILPIFKDKISRELKFDCQILTSGSALDLI
ncbi:MAG: MBL fold hydrolase [Parcubacteria group bacterium]|nr:MAG: MBL fold hydrolase [Parcubacteria group bacterium]